jgi:hypothetical protein
LKKGVLYRNIPAKKQAPVENRLLDYTGYPTRPPSPPAPDCDVSKGAACANQEFAEHPFASNPVYPGILSYCPSGNGSWRFRSGGAILKRELRRGFQKRDNAEMDRKMPIPDGH